MIEFRQTFGIVRKDGSPVREPLRELIEWLDTPVRLEDFIHGYDAYISDFGRYMPFWPAYVRRSAVRSVDAVAGLEWGSSAIATQRVMTMLPGWEQPRLTRRFGTIGRWFIREDALDQEAEDDRGNKLGFTLAS